MEKFLIVDGNSILNRAFYGLSNMKMTNSTGIHTNAIYGFLNIYWMILDKVNPDYVAISFDLKAPTFRHNMYKEYKGTRKKMPDELAEQMPIMKDVIRAMNIPILELEGYEADDILGTVSKNNFKKGIFTYILTGDKDSFQLISDLTSIIIPTTKMGKTEYTTYTPQFLKEKQGIEPYQVIHIKSLMGDSSDNIPGVKGIGEKTAYSLIGEYTTLENIYENINTLNASTKTKEKLINDKDMAFLSKELATINQDVPIDIDYEKSRLTDVNKQELYRIFKWLNFSKFLTKYDFSDVVDNHISPYLLDNNQILQENFKNKFKYEDNKVTFIDSDNLDIVKKDLLSLSNLDMVSYILDGINQSSFINNFIDDNMYIAMYIDKCNVTYILDSKKINSEKFWDFLSFFASLNVIKLGYNIKQDIKYFFDNNINDIKGFIYDVMIAYYLLDSNRGKYEINYIFKDLFNLEFVHNTDTDNQISLFDSFDNTQLFTKLQKENIYKYLKGIYLSYDIVMKKLEKLGMLELFNNIEMPLTETLASMEHVGMYIDLEKLENFNLELSSFISSLEKDIYDLAGEIFNINSTQQLGKILFEKLGLPTIKKNKTGYSTDKAVLDELSDKHEIIDKIISYRQLMKLKSTYVEGLDSKIGKDGRIHTTFMQTVASTGRLSSTEPNLQNIPIRLELGSKIRTFFTAEESNVIIDADYSQIELRVLAHISNDKTMQDAFKNNIDIHKVTASQVFDVDINDVTSNMRSKAKAVNFGIVYGISEFGLSKNISCTRKEAKEYIDNYLNKYQGIKNFMADIVNKAKEEGYVTTMYGRRRYIPEIKQKNKNIVQFGQRVAMNTPIQGTAADIIKLAMNKIYKDLKNEGLSSKLIMQVHDELIVEAKEDEVDKVKKIMYDAMEHVACLTVPLDIDLNVGKSWYEAK